MALPVTFNGTIYQIPETGDLSWGASVTSYLQAIASGALQKSGGSFTLTAAVDFGATYGLKSVYYSTRAATPATAGAFRLGNNSAPTEAIAWRNAANSANLSLYVNGSDQLIFGSTVIAGGSALTANRAMVTGAAGLPSVSATTDTQVGYLSGASGTTGTGSLAYSASPTFTGTLACAALTASGNITVSGGTASRAVYLDASKIISVSNTTSAQLEYLSNASGVTGEPGNLVFSASPNIAAPTVTGLLQCNSTAGPNIALKDTSGVWGTSASPYLAFYDSANTLGADLGFAAGAEYNFYINNRTATGSLYFMTNATLQGSINSSGVWTIGPSGGTSAHTINGKIDILTGVADTHGVTVRSSTTTGNPRIRWGLSDMSEYFELAGDWDTPGTDNIHTSFSHSGLNILMFYANGQCRFGTAATTGASLPILSRESDTDTGLYFGGDNEIAIGTGGGERLFLSSSAARVNAALTVTASAGPLLTLKDSGGFGVNANPYIDFRDGSGSGAELGFSAAAENNFYIKNIRNGIMYFATNDTFYGNISAAGAWTLGASGGTQSHVINGDLTITDVSGPKLAIKDTGTFGTNADPYIEFRDSAGLGAELGFAGATENNFYINNRRATGKMYLMTNASVAIEIEADQDVIIGAGSSNVLRLNNATQTTVGAAGAASALPANPTGYLELKINGSTSYIIPYYAKS